MHLGRESSSGGLRAFGERVTYGSSVFCLQCSALALSSDLRAFVQPESYFVWIIFTSYSSPSLSLLLCDLVMELKGGSRICR